VLGRSLLRDYALAALAGVGDTGQEWEEWTGRAFHLRRRLTAEEENITGPVLDVRGTEEGRRRADRMRRILPSPLWSQLDDELI
jgi:hypothetical protein